MVKIMIKQQIYFGGPYLTAALSSGTMMIDTGVVDT